MNETRKRQEKVSSWGTLLLCSSVLRLAFGATVCLFSSLDGVGRMCKHLLNAQVSIRYYNGNWYDCPLCFFEEVGEYPDMKRMGTEMVFACKKCKKCFRKDMSQFEEPDEYCPHCDNHFVIEAVTPESSQEEKTAKAKARRLAKEKAARAALQQRAEEKVSPPTNPTLENVSKKPIVPPIKLK